MLAIIGDFSLIGSAASGWLCDRFNPHFLRAGKIPARRPIEIEPVAGPGKTAGPARVLKFRIHLPPAGRLQTFSSGGGLLLGSGVQRLAVPGAVATILAQEALEVVRFPAIAEADEAHHIETIWGSECFRRRQGEALHPDREPLATLDRIRRTLGEYNFARPVSAVAGAARTPMPRS